MVGFTRVFNEARRRRVFRTAGIYVVAAWVAVQAFSEVFPALDIPASAIRYIWLGALVGLPIAIVFGWFYDVTADGIVRTAPSIVGDHSDLELRKTDYVLIAALAIAASTAIFQVSERVNEQGTLAEQSLIAKADSISIAVLPLENLSGDAEQVYFVTGIHDAQISDLSRVSGRTGDDARQYQIRDVKRAIEMVTDEKA